MKKTIQYLNILILFSFCSACSNDDTANEQPTVVKESNIKDILGNYKYATEELEGMRTDSIISLSLYIKNDSIIFNSLQSEYYADYKKNKLSSEEQSFIFKYDTIEQTDDILTIKGTTAVSATHIGKMRLLYDGEPLYIDESPAGVLNVNIEYNLKTEAIRIDLTISPAIGFNSKMKYVYQGVKDSTNPVILKDWCDTSASKSSPFYRTSGSWDASLKFKTDRTDINTEILFDFEGSYWTIRFYTPEIDWKENGLFGSFFSTKTELKRDGENILIKNKNALMKLTNGDNYIATLNGKIDSEGNLYAEVQSLIEGETLYFRIVSKVRPYNF